MIVVILFFVTAGLMMIPSVRQKIFGGGVVEAPALAVPGKPIIEKPRTEKPWGDYSSYLGREKTWEVEKDGVKYVQSYYLRPPAKVVPGEKYPLVVFLHDEKGMAEGALALLQESKKLPPFYLLIPQISTKKTWAVPAALSGAEIGKGKTAAQWTAKKYPEAKQSLKDVLILISRLLPPVLQIDETRLYAVGCGEGGIGVYGALAKFPEFFTGGLVASGLWSFTDAPKFAGMPVVIFHGSKDRTTDVIAAQGMAQVIQQSGGQVVYRELPNFDRNCADPQQYSAAVLGWLFSHRKTPIAEQVNRTPPAEISEPAGYQGAMVPPSPVPTPPPTSPVQP